jgi:hypothetical protein
MDAKLTTVKRSASARISRLTKEQALEVLRQCRERGATIDQPAIRELTGGFASQSLNSWVTRRVAFKAGLISREAAY